MKESDMSWPAHSDQKSGQKYCYSINDLVFSRFKGVFYLISASSDWNIKVWDL